ncbi:Na(+)-translocating NADH-quinone reductase subunit A [Adhaeretor mobilis]|uniref:Na(+)-translocating NADH-quinone reductase subunit A n=1 Tax=Adhaeretor mobilis TaxID=1930276 RepID=A0A517MW45_9BACT|nr:Na(+)-translocating NADH-quinone reductase subunit A [Adhaeretor mobilis]QDS99017.1 Na(+)-translocating NADH-quinone reductase subunit A [Adhaeretor mobilis]
MTTVTRIEKGLDLPIAGEPEQTISDGPTITQVALLGDDYVGMKPTMAVAEGDRVKLGQIVFEDKKQPGVKFTAPAAGKVVAINRGAKRKFESLVIEVDGDGASETSQVTFPTFPDHNLARLERDKVRDQLVAAGLWTALRTRPYNKTPAIDGIPHSLFITAMDTNPLAADPAVMLAKYPAEFIAGIEALSALTDGKTYVCRRAGSEIPGESKVAAEFHAFDGPHPAGLAGTHIHLLDPVDRNKVVWHIGYQDVVAAGHLFLHGKIFTERTIAIAGPVAKNPRLVRTRLGASLAELTAGEVELPGDQQVRVISGSVLSGRTATSPANYLGRFANQVALLAEGNQREFVGWMLPGEEKFSIRRIFSSAWTGGEGKRFRFTTNTGGSQRAIVPIGMYEQVMPLDLIATPLLKSLIVEDTENAQQLGALELAEEDLGLCTFVCPGKYEYGPILRENLTRIEHEG